MPLAAPFADIGQRDELQPVKHGPSCHGSAPPEGSLMNAIREAHSWRQRLQPTAGHLVVDLIAVILSIVPAPSCRAAEVVRRPPCIAKCIALEYEVWFPNVINWARRWGTPILGTYNSTDADVIDKHAEWFTSLGVDFLIVDWSNSSQNFVAGNVAVDTQTRANTDAVFAEYARLEQQRKPHPQIVILLGAQDEGSVKQSQVITTGALQDEANYVYHAYVERYPSIYFALDQKPLLPVYVGFNGDPGWRDSRFNVRIMSATLESQLAIYSKASSNASWSWYDRDPVPSHHNGAVETVTVTQAYPGTNGWEDNSKWPPWNPRPVQGRSGQNGQTTFALQWKKAVSYNPRIIILNQWNEFQGGDLPSADQYSSELSNDLEPTIELGCAPMAAVQQAIAQWKGIGLPPIDCSARHGRAVP